MRTIQSRHDGDEGFGLIEIVISMLLLAVLAVAMLPLIINGMKQAANNATLASATQLANSVLDDARTKTTCAGLALGSTTSTDTRGVPLTMTRTAGTCPATFPGTIRYTVAVVRTDTTVTLINAVTLVYVTGA